MARQAEAEREKRAKVIAAEGESVAAGDLYRRFARTGDELVRVAERIWYSILKED